MAVLVIVRPPDVNTDQGETLERVNGCNDGNIKSCWQQAWPHLIFQKNLKFFVDPSTRAPLLRENYQYFP